MAAGYRLLLVDIHWLDVEGRVFGPGYLLLDRGRVAALEPGEPGEEEQYAEMVAGGPGRLVVPGFAGLAAPELYVARGLVAGAEAVAALLGEGEAAGIVERHGVVETYYATLMAAWDAALNGVTRLLVVSRHPAAAAQAVADSGLAGTVLVPDETCRGTPLGMHRLEEELEEARGRGADLARVEMRPASCREDGGGWSITGKGLFYQGKALPTWEKGGQNFLLPLTAPWPLLYSTRGAAWRLLVLELHQALSPGYEAYTGAGHLAMVDLEEPPGWLPPEAACPACLGPLSPRVETVVSEGRVVVDGGEHLYLGARAAAEAHEKLKEPAAEAVRILGLE